MGTTIDLVRHRDDKMKCAHLDAFVFLPRSVHLLALHQRQKHALLERSGAVFDSVGYEIELQNPLLYGDSRYRACALVG